jgi:hypothetical protein
VSEAAPEGNPVRERVERYASLRSALRVLAPSIRLHAESGLDSTFAEIRGWLREAAASPAEGSHRPERASLLAKIDSYLDILAGEILAQLRAIPLAQLRATLPAHRDAHPDEVAALLDVCTSPPGLGFDAADLLDYLITLLATEAVDGRKRVTHDPVELVPALSARCAAAEATLSAADLARVFEGARLELERGEPLSGIVARVRHAKRENPANLFVPEVLRALVAYNAAAANRLEDLERAERDLEDAELVAIDAPVRRAARPVAAAPPEPERGSALESEGLRAIARALEQRLAGTGAASGVAGEIAAILDVDKLAKVELEALRAPAASPDLPALRVAVVLGLLGRRLPELRERLPKLGLDPDTVRERWVPEISAGLAAAMQSLVASNAYDEARRLADARNRFLTQWGEGATMPRGEGDSATPSTPRARRAAATRVPVSAPAQRRRSLVRPALYAVALALATTTAAVRIWSRAPGTVEVYSAERLAAISPLLDSGYRDGLGFGKTFIGTLGAEFPKLPRPRRDEAGREIARSLGDLGVREVLLFDARRRLLFHWENGRLAFPPAER